MDCRRDMPETVLFDILLFLPVVSLLRFKTVCKSWCSIIGSSSFIRQQLNHNSEKKNLIVQNKNDHVAQVFMLSGRKHEVCVNLNLEGIYTAFQIVDSCNGILCLGYEYNDRYWHLSLWNPATKQVRNLPELSYFSRRNTLISNNSALGPPSTLISNNFALCFDIKTNDYNIVRISLEKPYSEKKLNDSLVEVYNMSTDSWRTINKGGDFPIRFIGRTGAACKNEMCLFIGEPSTGDTEVIFYFDLTEEAYGTVPLPDNCSVVDYTLNFVKDKITYMEWKSEKTRDGGCYEIWRMDGFRIKENWIKLYKLKDSIIPGSCVDRVYLSKDEDFIMATIVGEAGVRELYVYYFATAEVKKLDVLNACNFENYTESMVSVYSKSGDGTS